MTDAEKPTGKVVAFTPVANEPPVTLIELDYKECRHSRFEVHRQYPTVFCRDCDVQLDPIFVLRQIASNHAQRAYAVADMKREADRLEKQVRRQQTTRRNPRRTETDALRIRDLKETKTRPTTAFAGDVSLTDQGAPSSEADEA